MKPHPICLPKSDEAGIVQYFLVQDIALEAVTLNTCLCVSVRFVCAVWFPAYAVPGLGSLSILSTDMFTNVVNDDKKAK